jgi:Protein of unknown function (DUF3563)
MYTLISLFIDFFKPADVRARERAEAYLAGAVDIYDLEYRMRALDRDASRHDPSWMSYR